jgi:hypothetical protein
LITSSASGRTSFRDSFATSTIQAIGVCSSELTARMMGSSASSGMLRTAPIFSETSSRATSLFTPQSYFRMTRLSPSAEVETISRRFSTVLSSSSWRRVTSSSTSSGPAPG